MIKLNAEFFKRESTWMNIIECVGAAGVQLMMDIPDNLTTPLWCYIALRVGMAFLQGVKKSV